MITVCIVLKLCDNIYHTAFNLGNLLLHLGKYIEHLVFFNLRFIAEQEPLTMYKSVFFKFAGLCHVAQSNIVLRRNAGHNKWSNIKHTKGAVDQQRALTFARFSRQMKLAIRGKTQ